jgi:AraC family L-rhamnose operon transcriptional activator RhaR
MDSTSGAPRSRFTDLNRLPISLQLGNTSVEILGWGFLGTRWWRNYLHVHSFYEVCYAFEGDGWFRINDVDHAVGVGDIFIAKPHEPHEIVSSAEFPLGIYFWSLTLAPARERTDADPELDALLAAFAASRAWVSQRTPGMLRTLELLTEEVVSRAPGYRRNVAALVGNLIVDTARSVVDAPIAVEMPEPGQREATGMLVQRMARYLRDNYAGSVQIRDVAAQVHLSERHTSRLFHQAMGVSIKEFVTALRLEAAEHMLLNGRMPIKEVGEAAGFPDVQHFTTVFRQRRGLTPAAFRRQRGTRFMHPAGLGHIEA